MNQSFTPSQPHKVIRPTKRGKIILNLSFFNRYEYSQDLWRTYSQVCLVLVMVDKEVVEVDSRVDWFVEMCEVILRCCMVLAH